MLINRRRFLQSTAALALAAPLTFAEEPKPLPIIDTHQHLWDLDKFRLSWLDHAGPLLKRNYLMADYLKAIQGLNVIQAVYMEVAVAPEQQNAEADWIIDLCKAKTSPTTAAVIGGRPQSDGFREYVTRFKGSSIIKGVRSSFPKDGATNHLLIDNLKLLGDLGMSYDLLADPSQLPDCIKLVDACPSTRFILDHCGNASTRFYLPAIDADAKQKERRRLWEESIAALGQRKHVICKISGVAEAGDPKDATAENIAPVVNRCLNAFGDDRVIFASNWPVCLNALTFAQWVTIASQITAPRGAAFQQKLFHDNAARFYGLSR